MAQDPQLSNENLRDILIIMGDTMIDHALNKPGGLHDQMRASREKQPDVVYGWTENSRPSDYRPKRPQPVYA